MTGESLPATKSTSDEVFSGSTCKQGEGEAIGLYLFYHIPLIDSPNLVIGTGVNTFFGRAAKLVGNAQDEIGHLQAILAKIGNFCIIAIALFLIAEIIVM